MSCTQLSVKEQRVCYRNPREFHMLTEQLTRILGKFKRSCNRPSQHMFSLFLSVFKQMLRWLQ